MLFNLDFANNTILSYSFFILITDLHFLIPAVITEIFNPTAELLIIYYDIFISYVLISFGTSSILKLSKYVTFSAFTYNAIQWVPTDSYSSRFIIYAPSFILGKLFLE